MTRRKPAKAGTAVGKGVSPVGKGIKGLIIAAGAFLAGDHPFNLFTYSVREDENRGGQTLWQNRPCSCGCQMRRERCVPLLASRGTRPSKCSPIKVSISALPFMDAVKTSTRNPLTYTSETATINTFDSRRIDLRHVCAKYRVVNPALFGHDAGHLVERQTG